MSNSYYVDFFSLFFFTYSLCFPPHPQNLQLQQENTHLLEHIEELKFSLNAKEENLSRLKVNLDEQTALVTSLRQRTAGEGGCKGSIMNELEDMVMSQVSVVCVACCVLCVCVYIYCVCVCMCVCMCVCVCV